MPAGVVDAQTAVIQDDTAAIVVRVDAQHGTLRVGDTIEVHGVRSTLSGMETLRATAAPLLLGTGAPPPPLPVATVDVSEGLEAQLVLVAGLLPASARRAASGTVTFDVEDEAGTVRVVLPASLGADDTALVAGAIVEVVGVIGQETTGSAPLDGYRIWPRTAGEVRVVSPPAADSHASPAGNDADAGEPIKNAGRLPAEVPEEAGATLGSVGTLGLADLRVGATLVLGGWPELAIGGLLWDGERLVAIAAESAGMLSVLGPLRPPVPVVVSGLRLIGSEPRSGVPLVALGSDPSAVAVVSGVAPPRTELPGPGEPARWVTLVGRVVGAGDGLRLEVDGGAIRLENACSQPQAGVQGVLSVTGIGLNDQRVIVPCDGMRVAPTLADTDLPPGRDAGAARTRQRADDLSIPAAEDVRRRLAAWLLALGVLVVAVAAIAWRRYSAAAPPEAEDAAVAPSTPGGQHLTLVRLRREGGS